MGIADVVSVEVSVGASQVPNACTDRACISPTLLHSCTAADRFQHRCAAPARCSGLAAAAPGQWGQQAAGDHDRCARRCLPFECAAPHRPSAATAACTPARHLACTPSLPSLRQWHGVAR